jgi:hypothetical protein
MFVRAIHVLSKYSLTLFVGGLFCCVFAFTSQAVFSQAVTFAGNAQHTSTYPAPAQNLNVIKWTANIDLNNTGTLTHYGSPLITASNTVLVPVKTAGNGFKVDAFNGATGSSEVFCSKRLHSPHIRLDSGLQPLRDDRSFRHAHVLRGSRRHYLAHR